MSRVSVACVVALVALAGSWPSPSAAEEGAPAPSRTERIELTPALEVWASPVPDSPLISVRLELAVGLELEAQSSRHGLAATALAALIRGRTPRTGPGATQRLADEAGLATRVDIAEAHVSVTLDGPPQALDRALWIQLERASGPLARSGDADAIRGGLWAYALESRAHAISPEGDLIDTATRRALGPRGGHTPFASRLHASNADARRLVAFAADAAKLRRRVVVTGPPEALVDLAARLERLAPPDQQLPATLPLQAAPPPEAHRVEQAVVTVHNPRDQRRVVAAAWDLRGALDGANLHGARGDATVLILHQLLAHPGGPVQDALVDGHATVRDLQVRLVGDNARGIAVQADVRGTELAGARDLLTGEIERIGELRPPIQLVRAAGRAAETALSLRWSHAGGRGEAVAMLLRTGRASTPMAIDGWVPALRHALARVTPKMVSELAAWGLREDRRVVVQMRSSEEAVVLDAEAISDYLRLMVDIKCPPAGRSMKLLTLLHDKYGLTPQQYVALTQAIANSPERLRELQRQSDERCLEYKKLRSMMTYERALALHRAVACGPGKVADEGQRERALQRIFDRFDLDPSVYRPLLAMAREDVVFGPRLAEVDTRCKPQHGPAAPRR